MIDPGCRRWTDSAGARAGETVVKMVDFSNRTTVNHFDSLASTLREMPEDPPLGDFRTGLIEGTDSAYLVFLDTVEEGTEEDWNLTEQIMGDRRALMQGVRVRYIGADPETMEGQGQAGVVESTNSVENIFFLLAQLTREYQRDKESVG